MKSEECHASTIRQRLAEEKAFLDQLDAEREYRGEPNFGRAVEDRVIWRELLILELHDIDEEVKRICQTTGEASDQPSRKSNSNPESPLR